MNYVGASEFTNLFVKHLRQYFADVNYYGWVFNKSFAALGRPHKRGERGEDHYLIATKFADSFRMYPHVLVSVSQGKPIRLDRDNRMMQVNGINEYGRNDVAHFIHGGDVQVNISLTVRSMNQLDAEQIGDLLIHYSNTYGWEYFKPKHWFLEPFSGSAVSAINLRDGSDTIKVYQMNLNTSARGQWLQKVVPTAPFLERVNVDFNYSPAINAERVEIIDESNGINFNSTITSILVE